MINYDGMAIIMSSENGTRIISRQACAWRAKTRAAARPSPCNSLARQRHEGGREGALGEEPAEQVGELERHDESVGDRAQASIADSTISRRSRPYGCSSVELPTVAMASPKLMGKDYKVWRLG